MDQPEEERQSRLCRDLELRLAFINDIKSTLGCFYCAEDDPVVLEFHHVDPDTKVANVSSLVQGRYAISRIVDEVSRCLCVCRNHHARLTSLRLDYVGSRKRRRLSRTLMERKRREGAMLAAKKVLQASHPNVLCRRDETKVLRVFLGT